MNCLIYADGELVNSDKIIGLGLDGYVIHAEPSIVIKVPRLFGIFHRDGSVEAHPDNKFHLNDLETEKEVYHRLKGISGIANLLSTSPRGLTLEYYARGSLEDYMHHHQDKPPPWGQRLHWISQIVDVIAACHGRGVLVFDIALRNFLLADDWSIRAIDFANSSLLTETDFETRTTTLADSQGYTAEMDMLHVANVMYSISRWEKFQTECIEEDEWPRFESLPSTQELVLGHIITKIWRRQYSNLLDVHNEIVALRTPSHYRILQRPVLIGCCLACIPLLVVWLYF